MVKFRLLRLNTTVGRESTIDRDDDAGDEAGGIGGQPDCRADQFVRFAEASHGRVVDDLLAAAVRLSSGLSSRARFCSPMKKPGAMALTRMPGPCFWARSMASQRVKLSMADLEAA